MNFKQILAVKPNSLSEDQKQELNDQGIVVIELNNPNDVKLLTFYDGIKGDDFLESLIVTCESSNYAKEKFAAELFKRLLKRS